MDYYDKTKDHATDDSVIDILELLKDSIENTRIKDGIKQNKSFTLLEKMEAIIAARYLNSVKKGENALELAYILKENENEEKPEDFIVPEYIKEAIRWIWE